MNEPQRPLAEHHRRAEVLANEVLRMRQALPRRDRLLIGLIHALRAVIAPSDWGWNKASGLQSRQSQ